MFKAIGTNDAAKAATALVESKHEAERNHRMTIPAPTEEEAEKIRATLKAELTPGKFAKVDIVVREDLDA